MGPLSCASLTALKLPLSCASLTALELFPFPFLCRAGGSVALSFPRGRSCCPVVWSSMAFIGPRLGGAPFPSLVNLRAAQLSRGVGLGPLHRAKLQNFQREAHKVTCLVHTRFIFGVEKKLLRRNTLFVGSPKCDDAL
jgi:hypothetical protein